MWGNSQTEELTAELLDPHTAAPPPNPPQGQLIRVSYARPENWRFLFWAKTLDATPTALTESGVAVVIWWNVTVGVGRAQVELTRFEQFEFVLTRSVGPPFVFLPGLKYTASTLAPLRNDNDDPLTTPRTTVIDHLVAQDIQVRFQAFFGVNAPPNPASKCKIEVGCLFSPNVHVRPEWMARVGVFHGGEASGQ